MRKNWQRWTFVAIILTGILSGSKLLAVYEEKAPTPALRKTIKTAREEAEARQEKSEALAAKEDSVAQEKKNLRMALIQKGLDRIGTPYVYGGTSVKGFDCSGFVYHIFSEFDIKLPRSSSLMAGAGERIEAKKARRGDILIFTGTNSKIRKPGHVGIVISKAGEPLEFVHASSVGGVKISKVPGTNYEKRFLEARRVL